MTSIIYKNLIYKALVNPNNKFKFIIGVHNNTVDSGLKVDWWRNHPDEARTGVGIFKSSHETKKFKPTDDEFVLVSNLLLYNKFFNLIVNKNIGCNIALQAERSYLVDSNQKVKKSFDDGSMSIYFGAKKIPNSARAYSYINIEAGGKENPSNEDNAKNWQKAMIRFVVKMPI